MNLGPEYQRGTDGSYRKVAVFPNGAARLNKSVTVVLVRDIAGHLIKAVCGAAGRKQITEYNLRAHRE